MPRLTPRTWTDLAARQDGVLARRQLHGLGLGLDHYVDRQVRARRWSEAGEVVVVTHTGALTRRQLMWVGVLHAGAQSAVGGLTALEWPDCAGGTASG